MVILTDMNTTYWDFTQSRQWVKCSTNMMPLNPENKLLGSTIPFIF